MPTMTAKNTIRRESLIIRSVILCHLVFCVGPTGKKEIFLFSVVWGVSRCGASNFSHVRKVTKRTPGTPRSPISVSIGLYQWGKFYATEFRSFSNLWFVAQRCSTCRPLKGGTCFLG